MSGEKGNNTPSDLSNQERIRSNILSRLKGFFRRKGPSPSPIPPEIYPATDIPISVAEPIDKAEPLIHQPEPILEPQEDNSEPLPLTIIPDETKIKNPEASILIKKSPPPPTARKPNLPGGFIKVSGIENNERGAEKRETLTLSQETIPWLKEPKSVNLARITLDTGQVFLFGNMIEGDTLQKAARALDETRSRICNNLFYTNIPDVINNGYSDKARSIANSTTRDQISYFANNGGQRVYFMRFNRDGTPVIIRIAVCDKAQQSDVLSVLTTQSRKNIKKFSKL